MSVEVMQGAPPFARLFSVGAVLWLVGLAAGGCLDSSDDLLGTGR